jgi:SAM-dependent methyltransferase
VIAPWLLEVLRCPRCVITRPAEGTLALEGASGETLRCASCDRRYGARGGVPDLVPEDAAPADFEAQWNLRLDGEFERPGRLFGNDPEKLTRWLVERCLGAPRPGEILVDAGCGSGEKAAVLARLYPECRVIGLDLSPTLVRSAARFADVPNLAFVRADLLSNPLAPSSIDRALSWGVLHHTADTERAMRQLARSVKPTGRLALWLYPHPSEAPVWRPYYFLRDVVHLGRGHRIPPRARLWLCRAECAAWSPALWLFYRGMVLPFAKDAPFGSLPEMSLRELYDAAVFLLYDALSPRYHDRPRASAIRRWFAESGFGDVETDGFGHHWGTRAR